MPGMRCDCCGGAGTIERDGKIFECECALWERVAASMPAYILSAKFLPRHLESPLVDCIGQSCFVTASWIDLRAIIKALMMKHYNRHIRITSDRELRDVFVGSKSRTALDEDAKVVYNSIEDLMGGGDQRGRASTGPDLVILRLNELGYKNKAAPGILEEAIVCRLDYGRPTWVVSNLDKPFGSGSYAWSESVWDLLTSAFAQVRVPRISPRVGPPPDGPTSPAGDAHPEPRTAKEEVLEPQDAQESPLARQPRQETKERSRKVIRPVPDEDVPAGLGIHGMGLGQKRGQKRGFGRDD